MNYCLGGTLDSDMLTATNPSAAFVTAHALLRLD